METLEGPYKRMRCNTRTHASAADNLRVMHANGPEKLIPAATTVSSKFNMRVIHIRRSAFFYSIVTLAIPALCFFNYYHIYTVRRNLTGKSTLGTVPQIKEKFARKSALRRAVAASKMEFKGALLAQRDPFNFTKYECNNFTGILGTTLAGPLEDQIWQFAGLLGLSFARGLQPVVTPGDAVSRVFRSTVASAYVPILQRRTTPPEPIWSRHNMNLTELGTKYNFLSELPTSWRHFHNYRENIKKHLKFQPAIEGMANEIERRMLTNFGRQRSVRRVGIYLRTSDVTVSKEHIDTAMNYFRRKIGPSVLFVVISDSIDWCKKNINLSFADVAFVDDFRAPFELASEHPQQWVPEYEPALDMCLLSNCDNVITTPNKFGWWAAYLSTGEKLYLDSVANFGSDIYPPSWISISKLKSQPENLNPKL